MAQKMTKDQLEPLWRAGTSLAVISEAFDISESWVSTLAHRWGFPSRAKGQLKEEIVKLRDPVLRTNIPQRPNWSDRMHIQLAKSRGHYADIAELAGEWGMTTKQVLARYHLVVK